MSCGHVVNDTTLKMLYTDANRVHVTLRCPVCDTEDARTHRVLRDVCTHVGGVLPEAGAFGLNTDVMTLAGIVPQKDVLCAAHTGVLKAALCCLHNSRALTACSDVLEQASDAMHDLQRGTALEHADAMRAAAHAVDDDACAVKDLIHALAVHLTTRDVCSALLCLLTQNAPHGVGTARRIVAVMSAPHVSHLHMTLQSSMLRTLLDITDVHAVEPPAPRQREMVAMA